MKKLQSSQFKNQGVIFQQPIGVKNFDNDGIIEVEDSDVSFLLKNYSHMKVVGENTGAQGNDPSLKTGNLGNENSNPGYLHNELPSSILDFIEDEDIKASLTQKVNDKQIILASELSQTELEYLRQDIIKHPERYAKKSSELSPEDKQKIENTKKITDITTIRELRDLAKSFPLDEWKDLKSKDELKNYLVSKL